MSDYSILVVDDQPENFEVIEALLHNTDHTLYYADDGMTAIDLLNKFAPDLVLLDVMMPEVDGIEVCKQIKANPLWQAIPVVMVTAFSSTENLSRCLAAGANDFLCKPVSGIELRNKVHSLLGAQK